MVWETRNTVNTPMDPKTRLDYVSNNADAEAGQVLYQSIVGSLMYAVEATRPRYRICCGRSQQIAPQAIQEAYDGRQPSPSVS